MEKLREPEQEIDENVQKSDDSISNFGEEPRALLRRLSDEFGRVSSTFQEALAHTHVDAVAEEFGNLDKEDFDTVRVTEFESQKKSL